MRRRLHAARTQTDFSDLHRLEDHLARLQNCRAPASRAAVQPRGEPARSAAASVQAEVGEVEARRHDAADQYGRVASRRSALPYAAGDVGLWLLAGAEVAAEQDSAPGGGLVARAAQAQFQRAAAVPEPQLLGAPHMPARL